ncbi:hypothetical protein ACFZDK_51675 [Streptomyces sp. NPDC007901]|uniref:hypothetical protein n=1 Tax=Streptomyces sp. NPDC007901 TaxID=3364785 RepID=UPI0036F029DB
MMRRSRNGGASSWPGRALAYLAAYDVHRAHVIGCTEATAGIHPFMNMVTQVMTQEPYAGARRVFWIVDNGFSHRGGGPPMA